MGSSGRRQYPADNGARLIADDSLTQTPRLGSLNPAPIRGASGARPGASTGGYGARGGTQPNGRDPPFSRAFQDTVDGLNGSCSGSGGLPPLSGRPLSTLSNAPRVTNLNTQTSKGAAAGTLGSGRVAPLRGSEVPSNGRGRAPQRRTSRHGEMEVDPPYQPRQSTLTRSQRQANRPGATKVRPLVLHARPITFPFSFNVLRLTGLKPEMIFNDQPVDCMHIINAARPSIKQQNFLNRCQSWR